MKGKTIFIAVALCLFSLHFYLGEAAETKKKDAFDGQPIEISADRLEANDEKKVVLFSGNAVAVQGDRVIKAEKIFIYYRKDAGKDGLKNAGRPGDMEKIEARGKVSVSQNDRTVTGEQAIYYQDAQKIIVTGNAVMTQGGSTVRGDKIEVLLNENRGIVEAGDAKRVKATIYPTEKKAVP